MIYTTRAAVAYAAKRTGIKSFWANQMPNGWRLIDMTMHAEVSPAEEFAKGKDFVAWCETHYIDEGKTPGVKGVLVVSCFRDELPDDLGGFDVLPQTPSLWDEGKGDELKATGSVIIGGRVRSEAESPVKLVHRLASEMVGKDRKEVIAACIEAGVNKSTAQTQYYKWAKAQQA